VARGGASGHRSEASAGQSALSPVLHHFTILFQKVSLLSLKKRLVSNDGIFRSGEGFVGRHLNRPRLHENRTRAVLPVWVFTESSPFTAMPGEPVLAFFIAQPLPHQRWGDIPTDRHSQGCNLSFADGHAQLHRWKAPKDSRSGDIHLIQPGGDREDHTWLLDGLLRIQ
jgi:prepilin-type processing-associated H-X9-DG protein